MAEKESFFQNMDYGVKKFKYFCSEIRSNGDLMRALKENIDDNDSYTVVAYYFNEVKFGKYEKGILGFVDAFVPEDKYFQEMRLFNLKEEIYLRKISDQYIIRILCDDVAEGKSVEVVDSESDLFGHRTDAKLPAGYVHLIEPGRKINITIPSNDLAEHYALVTRSYIDYDCQTGQAGYAFYRFLEIKKAKECKK